MTRSSFAALAACVLLPAVGAAQMDTAPQKQGVPAEMVRYPQTYHGGWTPWRMLHRYWVSMQWVDRWLKGKQAS